jgi:hypothetical protein
MISVHESVLGDRVHEPIADCVQRGSVSSPGLHLETGHNSAEYPRVRQQIALSGGTTALA